jgi:murein DD-endopeptidase MepM/ murein hydrolase activator NlpD
MYAHLSKISVKPGQKIPRGYKIALSGNSGYSFGPHLHFTVYYSAGLKIKNILKKQSGCYKYPQRYKLPIASVDAYADPFDYLPKPTFSRLAPVKFGDANKYVRELQNILTYQNVFPRDEDIDGDFGPTTEKYLQI